MTLYDVVERAAEALEHVTHLLQHIPRLGGEVAASDDLARWPARDLTRDGDEVTAGFPRTAGDRQHALPPDAVGRDGDSLARAQVGDRPVHAQNAGPHEAGNAEVAGGGEVVRPHLAEHLGPVDLLECRVRSADVVVKRREVDHVTDRPTRGFERSQHRAVRGPGLAAMVSGSGDMALGVERGLAREEHVLALPAGRRHAGRSRPRSRCGGNPNGLPVTEPGRRLDRHRDARSHRCSERSREESRKPVAERVAQEVEHRLDRRRVGSEDVHVDDVVQRPACGGAQSRDGVDDQARLLERVAGCHQDAVLGDGGLAGDEQPVVATERGRSETWSGREAVRDRRLLRHGRLR